MADTAAPASSPALPREDITQKPNGVKHLHGRHRKASDPFRQLDALPDKAGEGQPEATAALQGGESSKPQSILMDLVLTPLNLIAFVLSLTIIDHRQRQWRLSQHSTQPDSLWYRVTHWSWLHPEPYQDSRDGTWKHNPNSPVQSAPPSSSFAGWSTQKKHGAVAKMAMDDAFAIRGRVLVALAVWTAITLVGIVFVAKRMFGWAWAG